MTDAQARLGVLLSIALLAVAGLLRFWEKEEEPSDPAVTAEIWAVPSDQVVRIEREAGGEKLILAKEGSDWRVIAPFEGSADNWAAMDLVNDVTGVEKGIPIPEADPASFGLGDPPQARVTVTLADGTTKTLDVGKEAPVGRRTYVRAADGGVAAVGQDLSSLESDVEAFRDHKVVRFAVGDVTRVRIDSLQGVIDISKSETGWWLEGFTRADEEKLEFLLMGILDLRFDEILPAAEAPPVDDPEYTVTVALADGTTRRFAVQRTPGIQGRLVAVEGGSSGWVPHDAVKLLGQGPGDLGDQHAFPFQRDAISKIEVSLGETKWAIERAGDDWKRDGADVPNAPDVLDALERAAIDYAPPPIPPLTEAYGTVTITEGDKVRIVDVGQIEGGKWRVADDRAGGEPYLVPLADLTVLAAVLD